MALAEFIEWVRGRAAEGITSVQLSPDQVDDGDAEPLGFDPNRVYLEVRVRQMWLTKERELWREFQPFGAVVTQFLHQGNRVAIPSILGSSELNQKMDRITADDAVEISNLRVAGPFPYEGDDLDLLLALFRTKTDDWLARTLRVVEGIAKAISLGGLTTMLPVAGSIVDAVTQFLGMQDLELRVGQYRSWAAPSDPAAVDLPADELQPMHYLIMRRPAGSMTSEEIASLYVKDGRLHHRFGTEGRIELRPYTGHDFMLISIEPRKVRDDYKKLEFYRLWQQAQRHVIDEDMAAAERAWRRMVGALYTPELTEPQQEALYQEYKSKYAALLDRFALQGAFRSEPDEEVSRPQTEVVLDDEDPAELLRRMT